MSEYKKFGPHYVDVGLIESVSFEEGGNANSRVSLKPSLIVRFRSGHSIAMIKDWNPTERPGAEGYEEFKGWWKVQHPGNA